MNKDDVGELTPIEEHIITGLRELNKQGQDEMVDHLRIVRQCGLFRKGTVSLEWERLKHPAPRSTRRTHTPEGGITP